MVVYRESLSTKYQPKLVRVHTPQGAGAIVQLETQSIIIIIQLLKCYYNSSTFAFGPFLFQANNTREEQRLSTFYSYFSTYFSD